MAWTTPKTWTAALTTAADFNTYIRDNSLILKTPWNSSGKLTALSSSYVADLTGTNVTGVARPGQANTYTAGKTTLGGTSRFVLPVGTDLFDGTVGNKTPGSMWVEGNYLHWVAETTKVEYRYLGDVVSTPAGAVTGSFWVEPSGGGINYVDASGVERRVYLSGVSSPHTDAAAVNGSVWVETAYLHWIFGGGGERYAHADTHTDSTVHSDVLHDDTHSDTHGDTAHNDSHGDDHGNHGDTYPTHIDYHGDYHGDAAHNDAHSNTHGDVAHANHSDHGDVAHDDRPENMGT